jgi:spermidine synthase
LPDHPNLLNLTKITFTDIKQKTRRNPTGFLFTAMRMLSFIWPIPVEHSGQGSEEPLELVLYNGTLHLNTKLANYSFGNLQQAFRSLFNNTQAPIDWSTVNNVLILGFGMGSVADLLDERGVKNITGVEINSQILDWRKHYCSYQPKEWTVLAMDANEYVKNSIGKFDLIIIDLYINLEVPSIFESEVFLQNCHNLLQYNGMLIFNKVVNSPRQKTEFANLLSTVSLDFRNIQVIEQMNINRFIIAKGAIMASY